MNSCSACGPMSSFKKHLGKLRRNAMSRHALLASFTLAASLLPLSGFADPAGFLETVHRHDMLASTVPDNGDQNPYAVIVAPVSSGKIQKDDVFVDNFIDKNNLQGLGTTIVDYRPSTKKL